jgi:putative inorganic carbon (HCO3(-)) transporter
VIEISIAAALLSWGLRKLFAGDLSLKKTRLNWILLAVFITSAISIFNAADKALVARALVSKCLKYVLLYFAIVETVRSRAVLSNIIKAALFSAVIVTADCYIQYYWMHYDLLRLYPSFKYAPLTDPSGFLGFPTGPFPFPNDLSSWMLIVLLPSVCVFIWGRKNFRHGLFLGAFLAPFVFLFYLANTRSAWLGFFASLFCAFLSQNGLKIAAIVILAILVIVPFLPREKVGDLVGLSSMQDRFYMWRIGWKVFLEHPVFGNGLNTFFVRFRDTRSDESRNLRGSYAHNAYLQTAADTGIAGLAAFLALVGTAVYSGFDLARRARGGFYKYLCLGLTAGLLAFLINGFFDTNLQSLPLVSLFWFALAIIMCMEPICERKI